MVLSIRECPITGLATARAQAERGEPGADREALGISAGRYTGTGREHAALRVVAPVHSRHFGLWRPGYFRHQILLVALARTGEKHIMFSFSRLLLMRCDAGDAM